MMMMKNSFVLRYGDRRAVIINVLLAASDGRPLDGDVVERTVLVDWNLILERQRLPRSVAVSAFIVLILGAHCRRLALRPHHKHLGLRLLRRHREADCSTHSRSGIYHRQPVEGRNITVNRYTVDTLRKKQRLIFHITKQ